MQGQHLTVADQALLHCAFLFQRGLLQKRFCAGVLQFFLQQLQLGMPGWLFIQFVLNLLQALIPKQDLALAFLDKVRSSFAVFLPTVQTKDIAQDALAVRRLLCGEQIRLALQEERSIDESLIIQTQGVLNPGVGFAHRAFGEHLPGGRTVFSADVEFNLAAFAARDGARYAVDLVFISEFQADFRFLTGVVDNSFVAPARLTVQRVGNRVQQGRLARAVLTGDAHQVQPGKINLHRLAVGGKTREGKFNRDHRRQILRHYKPRRKSPGCAPHGRGPARTHCHTSWSGWESAWELPSLTKALPP